MIEIKRWTYGTVICTVDADTLAGANLASANLFGANLFGANLFGANLAGANLAGANLAGAKLASANLASANLFGANLFGANLAGAKLAGAKLASANLAGAKLSGATGLLDTAAWLTKHFSAIAEGLIVYRAQNSNFDKPASWKWEPGAILTENAHPDRCMDCACGVSFATPEWLLRGHQFARWRCLIRWIDLAGVVVPYNTYGKARCERLELIEIVTEEELEAAVKVQDGGQE
jgi:hypothetical protein